MNIFELSKIPSDAMNSVGGKARGLKLLSANRLNVPEGFVITDIHGEIDLQGAVDYYVKSGLTRVAVRSSALGEDTIDFSGAGMYSTFLNVEGADAVKKAIHNCIKSLKSAKAKSYSKFFTNSLPSKMCVIVQAMVDADISGVCFTEAPNDAETLAIDAVAGLGEALTDGAASPHSYKIKDGEEQPKGDDLLSSELLTRIAREGRHASVELGYPLDLEWAVAGDELFWLQARPITTKTIQDPHEFDSKPMSDSHVYTTARIIDFLPGAVTPLTLSTVVKALDTGIRASYVDIGVSKHLESFPATSGVASFCNHLFFNLTELSKIGDYLPGASRDAIIFSIVGQAPEGAVSEDGAVLNELISNSRKYFNAIASNKTHQKLLKALADSFKIELWGKSLKWQIDEIDHKLDALDSAFLYYYSITSSASGLYGALYAIFMQAGLSADEAKDLQLTCLSDVEEIESVNIMHLLKKIAREMVLDNPHIANASAEEISEAVKSAKGDTKKAIDEFFTRYGHRGTLEMELRNPSWRMRFELMAAYIKSIIASNLSEAKKTGKANAYIRELDAKLGSHVSDSVKPLVVQARKALAECEATRSMCVAIVDQFKAAYHFLGAKMAERKLIPDADLIFFMTHSELVDFISKNDFEFVKKIVYNPELVKKAFARKRVYEAQKLAHFDIINVGKPEPITEDDVTPGQKILHGICSTPGKVEGKARVIYDLGDLEKLDIGEIMVTHFTDIGWTPYFNTAAGLITETGSTMSHGSVVAREFALPHITDAAGATQLIQTGDTILMDGASGLITIR